MGILDGFRSGKRKEPRHAEDVEWPDRVVVLSSTTLDEFIESYPLSVIDFWASWCKPCRVMKPRLRTVEREYRGRLAVGRINTERNSSSASRFSVVSIPTLIFFHYGEPVKRVSGVKPVRELRNIIDELIDEYNPL